MSTNTNMDVHNRSPHLEMAVLQKTELFNGLEGELNAESNDPQADEIVVRGKRETPLICKSSLGQTLLIPGIDRRTKIVNTHLYPWRMICSLQIIGKDGSPYVGTGWLAGPRLIITAGHCVFHKTLLGGWAEEITVIPGKNADNEPFGSFKSKTFRTLTKWRTEGDESYDVAAIILEEDVGTRLGYFSFGAYPDNVLNTQMINISGYPGTAFGEEQWHHSNRVVDVLTRKIYYDVDTEGGQSGSPIWIYENNESAPIVVGIHSYGAGNGIHANSGVRINNALAAQIVKWREISEGGDDES